jgi:hypothetical protein
MPKRYYKAKAATAEIRGELEVVMIQACTVCVKKVVADEIHWLRSQLRMVHSFSNDLDRINGGRGPK